MGKPTVPLIPHPHIPLVDPQTGQITQEWWRYLQSTPAKFRLHSSFIPSSALEMTVEATSDSTLTVRYKGSDGTIRSATIPLT